jgi:hypothetical protein
MLEESSGMRPTNYSRLYTKLMKKDSLGRMHVAVDMTSMSTFTLEQELTFVEKNHL